jgi:hypothetical protein
MYNKLPSNLATKNSKSISVHFIKLSRGQEPEYNIAGSHQLTISHKATIEILIMAMTSQGLSEGIFNSKALSHGCQ